MFEIFSHMFHKIHIIFFIIMCKKEKYKIGAKNIVNRSQYASVINWMKKVKTITNYEQDENQWPMCWMQK